MGNSGISCTENLLAFIRIGIAYINDHDNVTIPATTIHHIQFIVEKEIGFLANIYTIASIYTKAL